MAATPTPVPTPIPTPGRICRAGAAALLLAWATPALPGPVPWPDAPYSYYATNTRLEAVLADFAAGFSLSLSMAPDVGGVVNGRFTAKSPTEFISRLAGVYGFVWYSHAGTLFVSKASDITTRGISAPGTSIGNMRKALADLGVLEPRFGWGELGEQGVALVSGPPSYVNLVESTVRNLPARAQQLSVFRLQHASADDRTITWRDKEITTPGMATILRDVVTGRARSSDTVTAAMAPPRTAQALGGEGGDPPAPGGNAGTASQRSAGQGSGHAQGGTRPTASIQSDPRLNAIIIQDVPERMPLYQQLIAQLDVPTALVEIEAVIIDINTERARELGINWAGRSGNTAAGFGVVGGPASGSLTLAHGSGVSASSLVVPAGNYLLSQLRLLETDGDAQIHSRPSVLTSENLGALLDLSETFYIRSTGERVASVTPITAGTTLRVTPRVIREGGRNMVQLKIDIEDGTIQDRQIDALPTVRRSSVSTQAMVMQDEALLIAGYTSDQHLVANQRVPGLGDLPAIGALFSTRTRTVQKRERMFLIRPKVVMLPAPVPAAAAPVVGTRTGTTVPVEAQP
ncbi:MAG: type III secretion system outer membrane ring subunit SctC [Pseudomonadota bacterium]